jgi:hypothetical protein
MTTPDSISFECECPKGHSPTLVFSKDKLLSSLEDGSLRFWCNLCGDSWSPSEEEKRRIKDWISRQNE